MSNDDLIPAPSNDLAALAARINEEHAQCEVAVRAALTHAMEAGRLLMEAKVRVRHGEWADWLHANVHFSERTARLYMQVAQDLPAKLAAQGKTATGVAEMGLSLREAATLLASPRAPKPKPEPSTSAQPVRTAVIRPEPPTALPPPRQAVVVRPTEPEPSVPPTMATVTVREEPPSAPVPASYPPPMVYEGEREGPAPEPEPAPAPEPEQEEEEEPWPQATFAERPRSTLSAAMRAALQRDYMGNRGLWRMSLDWSAPKTVEYALYGLAALYRLNREGCTAQELYAVVETNHAGSLLYGVRLLGQLAVRNLRGDVVAKETALRLLVEQVRREDVLRLLRELSADEQQWVLDQVRSGEDSTSDPVPPTRTPQTALGKRAPGVYTIRTYWADDEDGEERITAPSALSAAKDFVRSLTNDLTADGDEKPYRGAIRIELVTGVLDAEEVYQGYRHPDPRQQEEWRGGEWQPVGPRFHIEGPH